MKGLQDPSTKPCALKTLTTFLQITAANASDLDRWGVKISHPPYLQLVLNRATSAGQIREFLWTIGLPLSDEDMSQKDFWQQNSTVDVISESDLLLCATLALIEFRTCEEQVQKFALSFFTHIAHFRPEVLLLLYDKLLEYLNEVLTASHNPVLLKEANALMGEISTEKKFSKRKDGDQRCAAILEEYGVSGIFATTNFRNSRELEKRCAGLTDKLIEYIIM